jgi:hypothetical protein
MTRLLIQHKADVNQVCRDYYDTNHAAIVQDMSALQMCFDYSYTKSANYLIDAGCKPVISRNSFENQIISNEQKFILQKISAVTTIPFLACVNKSNVIRRLPLFTTDVLRQVVEFIKFY